MGQKQAKFKCAQWNDAKSKWVPTVITLAQSGRLLSYNRATRRFIAGVRLSAAYRLFVFGPLCAKMKWTPPVPSQRPETCLLGIPTSKDAVDDPHLMCWFYFEQPQALVSLLEAILVLLDKRKVQRPKTDRSPKKTTSHDNSQLVTSSPTNYVDLTPWYAEGLAGAWCIAGMHVTEPGCFHHTHEQSTDVTVTVDTNLCSEALNTTDWGSNCGTQWDTSGVCTSFNPDSGTFCTVETHDSSFSHTSGSESHTDSGWASYDTNTHSGGSTCGSSGGASACGSSCSSGGGGGGGGSSCGGGGGSSCSSSSSSSSCGSSCSSS